MQVFGAKLPTFSEFVNRYVPRLINKTEGTYTYGANNKLPQEIIQMVSNNAAILKALRLRSKYIYANGFQKSGDFIVDIETGKTANQLFKEIVFQKSLFGSVDLYIKKKMTGDVIGASPLSHELIRRRIDGDFEMNPKWGMSDFLRSDTVVYKAFTQGKPKEVKRDKKGNLLGEILYHWNKDAISYFYPIPDWFAGEMDIRTSSELSAMDLEMAVNSFMTSGILTLVGGQELTEAEEGQESYIDQVTKLLTKFTGGIKNTDGTSDRMRMLLLTAPNKDAVPVLQSFPVDKLISGSIEKRESVDRLVAMNAGVNPVLLGYDAATTLGNTQAMANAKNMLSDFVITDQEDIKQAFSMLWPNEDWSITRLKAVGQIDPKVMEALTENEKRALEGYEPNVSTTN